MIPAIPAESKRLVYLANKSKAMKQSSIITFKAVLLALAAMLSINIASAQNDWMGRRYMTEDPSKCIDMMLKEAAKDKDIQSMPAFEKQVFMGVISIAEIKFAIVFKAKNKFAMTVIARINEKAAKAANLELDREKRENISTQLNQMSADMKITGSYAIDGKKLVLTSSDGVQELTILEDGKKIMGDKDMENMVLVRVK